MKKITEISERLSEVMNLLDQKEIRWIELDEKRKGNKY